MTNTHSKNEPLAINMLSIYVHSLGGGK
jgi:hypothetical protein